MTETVIKISGLEKKYTKGRNAVHALRGVELAVNRGEFVSLRGVSGCGKTTLLLCAGGLLRPDGGEVLVNGINPYMLSVSDRSRFRAVNVGFVFQDFQLIPYLSVMDNIMLCSVAGIGGVDIKKRAMSIMERFNLGHRRKHFPCELSIGEMQRVALARAICGGAGIIFADEPTGNLDSENAGIILEFLGDFAKSGGAVLMVTHDESAGRYAFRNLTMKDGQLV